MLSVRNIVRIVLVVVCVAITLYLLWMLRKPISWLLIAIFLAVALSPPVNWLARRMKRGLAITIVYLGLLLIPILLIAAIVPPLITEGNNFADNVPTYARGRDEIRPGQRAAARAQRGLRHHAAAGEGGAGSFRIASAGRPARCATWAWASSTPSSRCITILVLTAFLLGSGAGGWTG